MDDQLKQRLLGATIVVALAVAFVPLLFDEQGSRRGDVTGSDAPPPPPETRERAIALPEEADEGVSEEQSGASGKTPERAGYRIIPLDDAPAPAAEAKQAGTTAGDTEQPTADIPVEFGVDEGGMPDELPTRDSPLANAPRTTGKSSLSPIEGADSRTRAPAAAAEGRNRSEPAGVTPLTGSRTAAPKVPLTKETRPAPAARSESTPAESAKGAASVLPKTVKPAVAERAAATVKSTEKSGMAAKPPDDKTDSIRKPAPPSAITSTSPTATRPLAHDSAAGAKSAKTAEPAKANTSPVRKPAEAKTSTRLDADGNAEPPRSLAQIAEPAKPAMAKSPIPRTNAPSVATEPAPKKKPDSPAAGVASAAGVATRPPAPTAQTPSPATRPAAAASKPKASAEPSRWVVRAGTFTSETSARELADKLKKKNFPAYVHKATGDNGPVYRVQVGSASEKSRAEQTRQRLETSAGIRGTLVPHR